MKLLGIVFYSVITFIVVSNGYAFADKLPVFVSILPLKYFVDQIGGDRVDASTMVRAGANPATYEPKPKQMADIAKARVYFAVGVPFENVWLNKIAKANPAMHMVHTQQGITKIHMARHHHHNDDAASHGAEEGDEHGILDPHIWLSPPLAGLISRHILAGLIKVDPDNTDFYEDNFRKLSVQMDKLHTDLSTTFSSCHNHRFIVFHPAWGYLAQTYGLQQVPIEIEGKSPKPAQLMELIKFARHHGIKVIFAQPQFSAKSANQVAREINGRVILVDPLAYNWADNLRRIASKLQSVLR